MRSNWFVATITAALLAACAPQAPPRPADEAAPPGFPAADYRQAAARGEAVFEIDPARSLVVFEVRRTGALAQLGHDHVVASHDVRGYVAPDAGRADLYLRLDELAVDEAEMRADAKFDSQPSASAIAGTRENMLDKLHADAHPFALVAVRRPAGDSAVPLVGALTLNAVTVLFPLAVQLEPAADGLRASGRFTVAQTDFGIAPFSILAGALQVEDAIAVRFEVRARRIAR